MGCVAFRPAPQKLWHVGDFARVDRLLELGRAPLSRSVNQFLSDECKSNKIHNGRQLSLIIIVSLICLHRKHTYFPTSNLIGSADQVISYTFNDRCSFGGLDGGCIFSDDECFHCLHYDYAVVSALGLFIYISMSMYRKNDPRTCLSHPVDTSEIGRASCRERVWR